MRTISEKVNKNLKAQLEEAKTLGLTKIASNIESQLSEQKIRSNDSFYSYAASELLEDVEFLMYKAALRVQDYYDKAADQPVVAKIVHQFAEDFIKALSSKNDIIGPNEPRVPGEIKERTELEVGED